MWRRRVVSSSSGGVGGAWFPAAGCSLQVTALSGSCQLSGCIVGKKKKKVWQRTMWDLRVCCAHFNVCFFFFVCIFNFYRPPSFGDRGQFFFSFRRFCFIFIFFLIPKHVTGVPPKPMMHLAGGVATVPMLTLHVTKGPTMDVLLELDTGWRIWMRADFFPPVAT